MSSPDTWFVKTGFGTVLGPMPTDVLAEMVRTQELLPADLVRASSSDDWQPASEVPTLFPTKARIDSGTAIISDPPEIEKAASSTIADFSNVPKSDLLDACDPLVADDSAAQPIQNTTSEPARRVAPISPLAAARHNVAQKTSDWLQHPPHWPKAVALAIVLLVIWGLWPRSQNNIYPRVVAIWDELQTRRAKLDDTAGWEQFLVRANSELDQIVPWLEEHASPKDRELQLLLFASRDSLRVMLKKTRDTGLPQEKRLRLLFKAIQEQRDRSGPSRATADAIADQSRNDSAKNLDPEDSSSVLIIESFDRATAP